MKAELVSRETRHADVGVNATQDKDELGIEGLTIVLHLKGRDDLIIKTDLTMASEF